VTKATGLEKHVSGIYAPAFKSRINAYRYATNLCSIVKY